MDRVGDVNGDGLTDVLVNAGCTPGGSYVIFGKRNARAVDLRHLGAGGLTLKGTVGERTGAGDVNGDGLADVVVPTCCRHGRYSVAVVFGRRHGGVVDVNRDGFGGFRIVGWPRSDSELGIPLTVAGGRDVNGDGRPDVVIGSLDSNSAYVVFGSRSTARVDVRHLGRRGFIIDGTGFRPGTSVPDSVAMPGDVNGDGRADLLLGAVNAGPAEGTGPGAWVVFGKRSGSTVLLNRLGKHGYRILHAGDGVLSIGDVNGDGRADLFVEGDTKPFRRHDAFSAFVIYGRRATRPIDAYRLHEGGYEITGSHHYFIDSLTATDDLNGDHRPDIAISHQHAGPNAAGALSIIYSAHAPPRVEAFPRAPTVSRHALRLSVPLLCPATTTRTCTGRLTLRATPARGGRTRTLLRDRRFTILAGQIGTLPCPLSAATRRALRTTSRWSLSAIATARDDHGLRAVDHRTAPLTVTR